MKGGANMKREMLAAAVVVLSLAWTDAAHAQDVCNVNNVALPPSNATSPGNPTIIGDDVTYSFNLSAGLIDPGDQVQINAIQYSLACNGGGFVVPGCATDGGAVVYTGDASIVTDCPPVLSTDNVGGGSDSFTLNFTPPVTLVEGQAGCNVSFNGNVVAVGNDGAPLVVQGASGIPPGGGECTDPENGLNASGLNSFAVDVTACEVALDKCVAVDTNGNGVFTDEECFVAGAKGGPAAVGTNGDDIQWRIVVTDADVVPGVASNGPAGGCVVNDNDLPFASAPFELVLGVPTEFTVPGVCGDATEGVNLADVTCNLCAGRSLSVDLTDNDTAELVCQGIPDIDIVKEVSIDGGLTFFDANDVGTAPTAVFPSDALYRLTVENTGEIELENVTVSDPELGIVNAPIANLAVGEVRVLTEGNFAQLSVVDR